MSVKARFCRIAIAAGLFLALSSCDENFGDHVEDFVNNRVGPLSEKFAEADLRLKWQTAFNITLADTDATLDTLAHVLTQIKPATYQAGMSVEDGLEAMQAQSSQLAELSGYETSIDSAISSLDTARSACTSDKIFQYARLSNSGLDSIAGIVLPDGDLSVYASNNAYESLARNFISWFGSAERHEQFRKARDAIRSYPQHVISDAKLNLLSTSICQKELTTASSHLDEQRAALVTAKAGLQDAERSLIEGYHAIEANVLPRSYQETLARSGTQRVLLEAAHARVENDLLNRFSLITREIVKYEAVLGSPADCQSIVNGLSDYKDLLDETGLQLDAVKDRTRIPNVESAYQNLRTLVASKEQGYRQLAAKVGSRGCRA